MGERTNNIITKEFTYDIPDDYLGQTNDENKTATWTYEGPDQLFVFAYKDSNIVDLSPSYTIAEDGDEVPEPIDKYRVKVDTTKDNHMPMASIIWQDLDFDTLTFKSETLPDGSTWRCLDPLPPHEAYDDDNITYDKDTNTFTYPWMQPHIDWEEIKRARVGLLDMSDEVIKDKEEYTTEEIEDVKVYRQKLRDLPDTFAGMPAWKVSFPETPACMMPSVGPNVGDDDE